MIRATERKKEKKEEKKERRKARRERMRRREIHSIDICRDREVIIERRRYIPIHKDR